MWGLSGTSANAIGEGPFAGGRGAWVASVRRSYLDFLLDRIDPEGSFGFGFSDALGKVTFDVNPRHQLQVLTVIGRSLFDEAPEDLGVNDEAQGKKPRLAYGRHAAVYAGRAAGDIAACICDGDGLQERQQEHVLLDSGEANDVGWRADVMYALRDGWIAEFGGDVL